MPLSLPGAEGFAALLEQRILAQQPEAAITAAVLPFASREVWVIKVNGEEYGRYSRDLDGCSRSYGGKFAEGFVVLDYSRTHIDYFSGSQLKVIREDECKRRDRHREISFPN